MKNWMKLLAFLLLLTMILSACEKPSSDPSDDSSDVGQSDSTSESNETETAPTVLDPTDALIVVNADGTTEYTLVRYADANTTIKSAVSAFNTRLWSKTRAEMKLRSDTDAAEGKELLVGNVKGRETTIAKAMSRVTAPNDMGMRICLVGDTIVIATASDYLIPSALELLGNAITKCTDGSYGIPKDFVGELDIPEVSSGNISTHYTGDLNHTLKAKNVTQTGYNEYVDKLLADGFREYTTNQVGECYFGTYLKEKTGVSTVAYTMYFKSKSQLNITYGPIGYLPGTEEIPHPSKFAAKPSVTQLEREGAEQTAPGLSLVIQLSDASFVIIDGGGSDAADSKNLYDFMVEKTPNGEKPVIAAWFITHAHGDHMTLATGFLNAYSKKVDLKMVVYSFPDFDSITINNESVSSMKTLATNFINQVNRSFPKAEHFSFHTGQKLYLTGCSVDFLYTPELYGSSFPWGNHSSSAFRFTFGEMTFMVTGDCEADLCQFMGEVYKDALKSTIFQPTHHGSNGGELNFYRYVDPEICLWAVDGYRFETTIPTYAYNKWLLDDTVKKREHYTASETKTIICW